MSDRKNWAAIGEGKSSSKDDKHHAAAGCADNSVHALREKNRYIFLVTHCARNIRTLLRKVSEKDRSFLDLPALPRHSATRRLEQMGGVLI